MNMNRMTTYLTIGWLLTVTVGLGQGMAPGAGVNDPSADLAKVFGHNLSFSAQMETTMVGKGPNETMSMTTEYAMLDGKVRSELNMSKIKSRKMPENAKAQMAQMGMDRWVNIVDPDKNEITMMYPGMKAYVLMPVSQAPGQAGKGKGGATAKVDKAKVGKETIDGHPCVKYKVTITEPNGRKDEAFTWEATDLKNFPIKIQMKTDEGLVTAQFKNIDLKKPQASLFEPPADYKKYGSMTEMMMGGMQGMMPQMMLQGR